MRPPRSPAAVALIAFITVLLADAAASAAPTPVTACGQSIDGSGALVADLDCSGSPDPGVRLLRGARLDLNGFTLSDGDGDGVLCEDQCRVVSGEPGGTITGFAGDGVVGRSFTKPSVRVTVSRTTVTGNDGNGVRVDAADGSVRVNRSEVSDNGAAGVVSPDKLRMSACTISGNQDQGVLGSRMNLRDSLVELNGTGVESREFVKLTDCDILDSTGDGIRASIAFKSKRMNLLRSGGSGLVLDSIDRLAKIFFSEISDNGIDGIRSIGPQGNKLRIKFSFMRRNGRHGVVSRDFRLVVSRVEDNAFHGVFAEPGGECLVRIDRFTLIGNGTDGSCGTSVTCADIASCAPPLALSESTECETSYDTSSGFPGTSWNACDDD